jgi:hypothetical protein
MPFYAQQLHHVCGEVNYVVPETQTVAEAKHTAVLQARIQALAEEFGTVITQNSTLTTHTREGVASSSFNSISENDVRGIWVEDTKEPVINVLSNNDLMVIHAKVCGKAKPIESSQVELEVQTLNYGFCNGEVHPFRSGYETTQYNDSDFFGVRLRSPVDGYVALLIRDDNTDNVSIVMPYMGGDGYAREVKSNQEYFFLTDADPEFPYPASTILTTERKVEHNTLIVVFSQHRFSGSVSGQGDWFYEMDVPKYQKWIQSMRKHDLTMQTQEIILTINNKKRK